VTSRLSRSVYLGGDHERDRPTTTGRPSEPQAADGRTKFVGIRSAHYERGENCRDAPILFAAAWAECTRGHGRSSTALRGRDLRLAGPAIDRTGSRVDHAHSGCAVGLGDSHPSCRRAPTKQTYPGRPRYWRTRPVIEK
jgi:hypothetical protein